MQSARKDERDDRSGASACVARWIVAVAVVAAAVAALVGCERTSLELIRVADVAPREVEVGDKIEITGGGFPQGRSARVLLRGVLHRPGEAPSASHVELLGTVVSAERIEIPFTESLEADLCGTDDRVAHTTFEGEVEVAFGAVMSGAPPISATLHGVTLDVRPPAARHEAELAAEADKTLAYLGVTPVDHGRAAPAAGLAVAEVAPDGPAARAGISPGDRIVGFDGVRVGALADLVPHPGARAVPVRVRRAAGDEIVVDVATAGLDGGAAELAGPALLLGAAVALIVFFVAPGGALGAWLARRIALRAARSFPSVARPGASGPAARGAAGRVRRSGLGAWRASIVRGGAGALAGRRALLPACAVAAAASALFAAMPFGRLIAADADVALLFLLATSALVTAAVLTGGEARAASVARRPRWAGAWAAAQVLGFAVPAAAALACVVVVTGTVRAKEIVAAQGGWPWEWRAFDGPPMLALFLVYAVALLADARPSPSPLPEAEAESALDARPSARPAGAGRGDAIAIAIDARARWFGVAVSGHVVLASGLGALVFLGGWRLPGVATTSIASNPLLGALAAVVLLLKTWWLAAIAFAVRGALPSIRPAQLVVLCWRELLVAAALAVGFGVAWRRWAAVAFAPRALSVVLLGVVLFAIARFVQRVRDDARSSAAEPHANPFL